jgi:SagB-type dehydrogenase family enzyme
MTNIYINKFSKIYLDKNILTLELPTKKIKIKIKDKNLLKNILNIFNKKNYDLNIIKNRIKNKNTQHLFDLLKKYNFISTFRKSIEIIELREIHDYFKNTSQKQNYNKIGESILLKAHKNLHNKTVILNKKFNFMYKRKSVRNFKKYKLSLNIIRDILNFGYGIIRIDDKKIKHRTTPSAGAFYPLILIYLDIKRKSVYKFDGYKLKIIKKFNEKLFKEFIKKSGLYLLKEIIDINNASGFIFIFSDLKYSLLKYGPRSYYFSLIESGHVLQNIIIFSTFYNIGLCEIGLPLNENYIKKFFKLNLNTVFYIISCVIGKPNER